MKFRVTFKTPDVVADRIAEFAAGEVDRQIRGGIGSGAEYRAEREEELTKRALEFTRRWVRYSELITVEFDLDKGTATVVSCR